MGVLQRFEQRLDALVNGAFAKAFKSEVQPVEIAGALQRECDDKAVPLGTRPHRGARTTSSSSSSPHDHERLGPYAGPLGAELAGMVRSTPTPSATRSSGRSRSARARADDLDTGCSASPADDGGRDGPAEGPAAPRSRSRPRRPVAPAAPGGRRGARSPPRPARSAPATRSPRRPAPAANPRLVVHGAAYPLTKAGGHDRSRGRCRHPDRRPRRLPQPRQIRDRPTPRR